MAAENEGFRTDILGGLPVEIWGPGRGKSGASRGPKGETIPPAGAVLLVHGFWAWSYHLRGLARPLALAGFRVYALSLRGHHPGHALPGFGKVHLSEFFDDVRRVATQVPALEVLVGHSLGGLLALKAAESVPVHRLVLLSPSPPGGVPFRKSLDAALGLLWHSREIFLGRPMLPDYWIAQRTFLRGLTPDRQKALYATMIQDSGTALREAAFIQMPVDFSKVTARTLVIVGSDDNVTSPRAVRRTAELLHAEHKEYPATGHHLMETLAWPVIRADILHWLN